MKFSIITVCRNAENTIERTIRSVVSQSYPNKEFIIIDGASTDGTKDVINKYRDKIDVFVSESDRSLYDAMNKGVKRATGDYVIFINADDYFFDENVLTSVAACGGNADFIFGDQFDSEDGVLTKSPNLDALDVYHLFRGYFAHQAIFAKHDLFEKFGEFDLSYKICADWDWILRCLVGGATTFRVELPISVFTVGGASGKAGASGKLSAERSRLIRNNLGSVRIARFLLRVEKIFRNPINALGLNAWIEILIRKSLPNKGGKA